MSRERENKNAFIARSRERKREPKPFLKRNEYSVALREVDFLLCTQFLIAIQ